MTVLFVTQNGYMAPPEYASSTGLQEPLPGWSLPD